MTALQSSYTHPGIFTTTVASNATINNSSILSNPYITTGVSNMAVGYSAGYNCVTGGPISYNYGGNDTLWLQLRPLDMIDIRLFKVDVMSRILTPLSRGANFRLFTENDCFDRHKRSILLALDSNIHRLELASIILDRDPIANLGNLFDTSFNVVEDKSQYCSTLYSRYFPIVGNEVKPGNRNPLDPMSYIELIKSDSIGILPIMHVGNIAFNNLLPVKPEDVAKVISNLSCETIVLCKEEFPAIQKNLSPEYAYLTLDFENKGSNLAGISRAHSDYTETGLYNLVRYLTIEGSNSEAFVNHLIGEVGLDQSIKDPAATLVTTIKQFIEDAY